MKEVNKLTMRLTMVLAVCLFVIPAVTRAITIEAETFVSSHNQGGLPIYLVSCSGASGGYAVEGFDHVGDWIQVAFSTSGSATYIDSLRSAGRLNEESDIRVTYLGSGPGGSDLISTFHTIGLGIS